jgi:uncharacterized membrane-anchored protein
LGLSLWTLTLRCGFDRATFSLFWIAFILTRPLGATMGDLLDKPHDEGGFALSRYAASAVLVVFIVACISLLPQRPITRASAS